MKRPLVVLLLLVIVAADYLFNFVNVVKIEKETCPLCVGIGTIPSIDMGGIGVRHCF